MNKMLVLTAILTWAACTHEMESDSQKNLKIYHSWGKVSSLAAQYGISDLVTKEKNGGLIYLNQEQLTEFMQSEQNTAISDKQYEKFMEQTKNVRCFDDYVTLLNTYSAVKADLIKSYGGETGYQNWLLEQKKVKWHIYREEKGGLTWIPAKLDDGTTKGVRLDNQK